MKTLWNIYTKVIVGVVLFVLFAAGGVNYYTKTQSDAKYYAKTQADTTFVKVADLVTPTEFDTLNITDKATVPTMPAGTSTTDAASTAFVNAEIAYDLQDYQFLKGLQAYGSSVKAIPLGLGGISPTTTFSLSDNRGITIPFYFSKPTVITGASFVMQTAGAYTADNYNGVALYSISGTTATLVGSSTDNGNIWKSTANTRVAVDFSSPITTGTGAYVLVMIYNSSAQTTQPVVYSGFSYATNAMLAFNMSNKWYGEVVPASSAPATINMTGLSTWNNVPFAVLY